MTITNKRFEILDIYRGIAILLVLFRHHEAFPFFNKIGWIGVSLFFVLSGYLISGILFKELKTFGKINIRRFYIRRGFKIYPGFYFFILVSFITLTALYLITGHKAERLSFQSFFIEAFFVQNYFHGLWHHTWSIAIEEHFYLLFPLLLMFFSVKNIINSTRFYLFTFSIVLIVLFFRIINYTINDGYDIYRDVFSTHLRIDGLVFGVMIGYDEYFNQSRIRIFINQYVKLFFLIFITGLVPIFVYAMESPIIYTLGFTTISISFSILLFYSLNYKDRIFKSLINKILIFIGTSSYAIYLWQGYIISFGMRFIDEKFKLSPNSKIDFLIFVILSVLTGWFLTKYFENYFLRLRSKFYPSKT
jgi:peptidoglycan/LPS O-acetylase OafA/YrhL